MKVLVTGGAGFIGSNLVRHLVLDLGADVLNIDKMTYAANPLSLSDLAGNGRYVHAALDICDRAGVAKAMAEFRPDRIMHLAAESHVDRSIESAGEFVRTNLTGTFEMLEAARSYWQGLEGAAKADFRFHHVSTDEVFGSLGPDGLFTPETPYDPRSPYSASKAGSDHLVRAWFHTYGLPTVISNCSNNYGPYHFPEKLIPLAILKALGGEAIPVYGKGDNVRDWLHVMDHVRGLVLVATKGRPGGTYLIGGHGERTNLDVIRLLTRILDEELPNSPHRPHDKLISFVTDRPGHDHRYAIDASATAAELGWKPQVDLEQGLRETVRWYLTHRSWWESIRQGTYRGERLGLAAKA